MESIKELITNGVIEMCEKGFTIKEIKDVLHIREDVIIDILDNATK